MSAPGNWKTAIANALGLTFSATGQAIFSDGTTLGGISGTPENPPANTVLLYVTDAGVLRMRLPDGTDTAVGGGGGGGGVSSVTGLNTDNTDPANPVVAISVSSNLTGGGTPGSPLDIASDIKVTNILDGASATSANFANRQLYTSNGMTIVFNWSSTTTSGNPTFTGPINFQSGNITISGGDIDCVNSASIVGVVSLTTTGNATIGGNISAIDGIFTGDTYAEHVTVNQTLNCSTVNASGNATIGGQIVDGSSIISADFNVRNLYDVDGVSAIDYSGVDTTFFGHGINAPDLTISGASSLGTLGLNGATPVAQGAAIADASGGVVQDAEARTAINDLLAYLRSRGDIAT